ncbi:MAG: hypothetical protein K0R11_1374 [Acidimicrobiales bacterium]|nr:hypothetical protein [Acidimicrobiales bacterium]
MAEVVPGEGRRPSRIRRPGPEAVATLVVVVAGVGLLLAALHPDLLVADTTPAGGDMGAHVWGPAFLRDHLLPDGRLSGWSPDWYAGFPAYHFYMVVPSLAIVALGVVLPYGVAFKLVSVSGLVTLPVAAWALGRLARARFPVPALLAIGAVGFLFERSFTIYGGNIASTLAGEFAFSISLSLAMVFLGLVLRGLETGRLRAVAAVALGLCALCHVIPLLFALVGAGVALALRPGRARVRWLAPVLVAGGALSGFWILPFVLRRAYLNDMGWEKLTTYLEPLLPGRLGQSASRMLGGAADYGGGTRPTGDLTVVAVLALVGVVASVLLRRRLGLFLALTGLVFAVAFVLAPQGRLWNARLLPFWYLCLYLLAALAVAELIEAVSTLAAKAPATRSRGVAIGGAVVAAVIALGAVAVPLRLLPFGQTSSDGARYSWLGLTTTDRSFVPDWARWNYRGYERKDAWPEYRELMATMSGVGRTAGCGRAMWEYEPELDRYGTPMALMLLPYWTDGCIGSMEGLYFEASATTPSALRRALLPRLLGHGRGRRRRGAPPPVDRPLGPVARLRGGRRRARPAARQPARGPRGRARRGQGVDRRGDALVPLAGGLGRAAGRRRTVLVAPRGRGRGGRPAGHPAGARVGGGDGHGPHLRRRGPPGDARAGEDVVLPQLGGLRGRGAVAGGPEPDGGRPDRHPRGAHLRDDRGRHRRLAGDAARRAGCGRAGPPGPRAHARPPATPGPGGRRGRRR